MRQVPLRGSASSDICAVLLSRLVRGTDTQSRDQKLWPDERISHSGLEVYWHLENSQDK